MGKEEIVKYFYKCDLCGTLSTYKRSCNICGKDICYNCTKFDPRSPGMGDTGNYPEKYCLSCFNIGKKYIDRMNKEQEKFDTLIEEIEQEWRDESIRSIKK